MTLRHVALARRPAAIAEVEEIDRVALPGHPLRSQEAGVPAKGIVNRAAGVIRSKRQPGPPVRASRIDARSGRLAHGSCTSIEEHAVSFAAEERRYRRLVRRVRLETEAGGVAHRPIDVSAGMIEEHVDSTRRVPNVQGNDVLSPLGW